VAPERLRTAAPAAARARRRQLPQLRPRRAGGAAARPHDAGTLLHTTQYPSSPSSVLTRHTHPSPSARTPGARRATPLALLLALLAVAAPRRGGAALTCAAADDATTCAALDDVFTATGGERWASSAGWRDAAAGTATDYCTFFGVTCSGRSLVTALCVPLRAHRTTRIIMHVVWQRAHLVAAASRTRRALDGNGLSGTIPDTLSRLKDLETLCVAPAALQMPRSRAFRGAVRLMRMRCARAVA
jgi:hypothetical protein